MRTILAAAAAMGLLIALAGPGCSDEEGDNTVVPTVGPMPAETEDIDAAHKQLSEDMVKNGLQYLLSQQEANGGWRTGTPVGPAYTAMIIKAIVQHPDFDTDTPAVKRGLDYVLGYRQEDGGIYDPENPHFANYTSSIALMSLVATGDSRFNEAKRGLVAYLKGGQIAPGSKDPKGRTVEEGEDIIGGTSYGKHGRPDGSNTGMWAEALHQAGVPGDDPAMQRMAGFFTRLQNRSESNATLYAREGSNDGGFYYAMGESMAGTGPGGKGLRSYGSLTYMGFKSMLYAGLTREDPRVAAAFKWIQKHWTLDSNPNMPGDKTLMGLYYYYHTYAKALRAWDRPIIKDADGKEHNWREELIDALSKRVSKDGSWVNGADRWYEGDPVLVTAYAVLALQEAMVK